MKRILTLLVCVLMFSGGLPRTFAAESATIAGIKVSVWRPASHGAASLVIFSHGLHGSSTQSTFLMKAMAEAGYLVVAPNHRDAGFESGLGSLPEASFNDPGAWTDQIYRDRADDIVAILDAMKRDPAWSHRIDWSKIALAGHSLGGYTVLGLAGAWPAWKRPPIKAVLALSPYCAPLIQNGRLEAIKVPVMYQGGTWDFDITPSVISGNGAYSRTAGPAYFVEFAGAGHLAWTDLNPRYQASIAFYCVAFLDKYVRGLPGANLIVRRPDVADLRSK